MKPGCTEVCDKLIRKLKAAGYKINNKDKAHTDVLIALEVCIRPAERRRTRVG